MGSNYLDFHRIAPGQARGAGLSGGGSKEKDCGASSPRLQVGAVLGAAVAFSEDLLCRELQGLLLLPPEERALCVSECWHILGIIHISDDPYDEETEAQRGEGLTHEPPARP